MAYFRGSKVVIDWHNYGYSILAQKTLLRPFVPIYRFYEMLFGRYLADANLAVTDAMNKQLSGEMYKMPAPVHTLHDRPAAIFHPIESSKEREAVLIRIPETRLVAKDIVDGNLRLIVSSTSWTPDEDFGLLLDALVDYGKAMSEPIPPVPVLAIITGKGPQQKEYIEKIRVLQDAGKLPGVRVLTAWLSNRDYAALLASMIGNRPRAVRKPWLIVSGQK